MATFNCFARNTEATSRKAHQFEYSRNIRARRGCRKRRSALPSICRIRSRVRPNLRPTCSRVCALPFGNPKRIRRMHASRGDNVASTSSTLVYSKFSCAASPGCGKVSSSIKAPSSVSPSSPAGCSRDIGCHETLNIQRTLSGSRSNSSASSSGVG